MYLQTRARKKLGCGEKLFLDLGFFAFLGFEVFWGFSVQRKPDTGSPSYNNTPFSLSHSFQ